MERLSVLEGVRYAFSSINRYVNIESAKAWVRS